MTGNDRPLPPGSTIGILGGGQLARMLALAAAPLGLKTHVYAPEADSPAFDVAAARTIAAYEDKSALAAFAVATNVVTYEFENVPVATAEFLAKLVPVRPGAKALATAQDRLLEKRLASELGVQTADFATVDSRDELQAQLRQIVPPAILKTRRLGYDGKGQVKLRSADEAAAAWQAIGGRPAILESVVDFVGEVSVIAARGIDGRFVAFDLTANTHKDHILDRSLAPAGLPAATAEAAFEIAKRVGEAVDYVGVFAIELFVVERAGGKVLLFNEMAPRVHNSGHWSIEGAETSQFEQHIRAVAGWPLGSTARRAERVEMVNLIGEDAEGMGGHRRRAGRAPASLWQGRGALGPQDGPCDRGWGRRHFRGARADAAIASPGGLRNRLVLPTPQNSLATTCGAASRRACECEPEPTELRRSQSMRIMTRAGTRSRQ